jgi:hypothetical protein
MKFTVWLVITFAPRLEARQGKAKQSKAKLASRLAYSFTAPVSDDT